MTGSAIVGWNPLASAGYGAGFGSFLAAIVLNATVQNAFRSTETEGLGKLRSSSELRTPSQEVSLAAATPALLLLLAATYLYIVLAGIPNEVQSHLDKIQAYAEMSAAAFSIAGTLLALGALMTLFILATALFEKGKTSVASSWASSAVFIAIAIIAWILLWGYYVGVKSARGTLSRPWWTAWWCVHVATMLLAFVASYLIRRKYFAQPSPCASKRHRQLVPFAVMIPLTALPTGLAVLIVSLGPGEFIPAPVASVISALLFGVTAAIVAHVLISNQRLAGATSDAGQPPPSSLMSVDDVAQDDEECNDEETPTMQAG